MTTSTLHLIADDNGVCISQALFEVCQSGRVRVVALVGATRYIDRNMSVEEAREEWRQLVSSGWTVPLKTRPMPMQELRFHIHG